MGSLKRMDFSQGWQPNCDTFQCPPNAVLRMDNLTLDEQGILALRQGSAKINSSAFSDTDVHNLFTLAISGTRYRMACATSAVYANGTSIASGFSGTATDDIQFGAHMGQILMARSTTKKKYDGTTVRNLGIAAPSEAPTISAIGADSKTFASCASTESPIMTVNEGTLGFAANKDGVAGAAVELTPDSTTARATATKTFSGPTDFTVYDGGQNGADEDPIEMDVFITEPQYLVEIDLMIDVNDGLFQSDYYVYKFVNGQPIEVALDQEELLAYDYTVEGYDRQDVLSRTEDRETVETVFRIDKPVSNSGWNHFSVPRGKFTRVGATSGKNWSTVKAVRVAAVGITGGSAAAVRFDEIQIVGGAQRALTGRYTGMIVAVRNDGVYEAKSAPSAISNEVELKGQGVRFTLSAAAIAALDTQVNELWAYLMGGKMDRFYRCAVKTTPFTGSPFDYTSPFEADEFTSVSGEGGFTSQFEADYLQIAGTNGPFEYNYAWELSQGYVTTTTCTIDVQTSDRAAMIADLRLERDNAVPPDSIIGIEGPHFDRTLYLTATHIYPSRQRNPDSCSAGEAVRVGDATETALWIRKSNEQVYVGTTRDVYRIDGDWTVLPDGTLNIAKRPLGVSEAPVSAAVTVGTVGSSDILVYHTHSGWKILQGPLLTGDVELLWRGFTRHGVSPVNTETGRLRCAIAKGVFYAITPEGASTTSSAVIHVYHFRKQKWYRFTYTPSWRALYAEPDGTLVAGETTGYVYTLDEATLQDAGSDIPVVLWTHADDNGEAFTYKEATNLHIRVETGSATATIAFHLNGNSTADTSTTTSQTTTQTGVLDIDGVSQFTQIQQRLTGSFSTFNYRGFVLSYRDNPLPLVVHDTNFIDLTTGGMVWVRRLRIKANSPGSMTVTPYWDGTAGTARTVTVGTYADKVYTFEVPLGRDDKGRTGRVTIETSSPSQVYWVEFEYNDSGKTKQKRISLVPQDERISA